MIMSPLDPTEDIGKSVRIFSSVIRLLFEAAACGLVKWTKEAELAYSTGPGTSSFVEILLPDARKLRE